MFSVIFWSHSFAPQSAFVPLLLWALHYYVCTGMSMRQ